MQSRHLVLIALALANLPVYYLLFRILFGKKARVSDLLDRDGRRESGGGTKLAILVFAAFVLVLTEYSIALRLFPALLYPALDLVPSASAAGTARP